MRADCLKQTVKVGVRVRNQTCRLQPGSFSLLLEMEQFVENDSVDVVDASEIQQKGRRIRYRLQIEADLVSKLQIVLAAEHKNEIHRNPYFEVASVPSPAKGKNEWLDSALL